MKIHKVTVLVIDFDDLGAEAVKCEMEEVHYPNHCISADVMSIETVEVDWSDDHPLNWKDQSEAEFYRLFPK